MLDIKVGYLHSYPNSDLQFENAIPSETLNARLQLKVRGQSNEEYRDSASMMTFTLGSKSQISIKTPQTVGSKTAYSRVSTTTERVGGKSAPKVRRGWYSSNNRRNEIDDALSRVAYSQFSNALHNDRTDGSLAQRIN